MKKWLIWLLRLLVGLVSIGTIRLADASELPWALHMAIDMAALILLIAAVPAPTPTLDSKFAKRAGKGDAIILSFQQYMALHYTAPERYPLQRDEVFELLRSEESNLHMNVQDYDQLLEVIKALEQDPNTPLAKFLKRSIDLLEQIDRSLEKKAWCHRYSVYTAQNDNHRDFFTSLDEFMAGAYENGLVINDYKNIIKTYGLDTQDIKNANYSWLEKQPKQCVLACIAWHFRNDHFCEGVLIRESIPSGAMLRLLRRLQSLCPDGDLSCM